MDIKKKGKKKKNWYKEYQKCNRERAYAWAMFFSEAERQFNSNIIIKEEIKIIKEIPELSPHLKKLIEDLYDKANIKTRCAICLDDIEAKDLKPHFCGHIFHKTCWEEYKSHHLNVFRLKCPLCRSET